MAGMTVSERAKFLGFVLNQTNQTCDQACAKTLQLLQNKAPIVSFCTDKSIIPAFCIILTHAKILCKSLTQNELRKFLEK